MKKLLLSAVMAGITVLGFAQNAHPVKKPHTFGVHFLMNDFVSAQRIENNSFGGVLSGNDWAQFKEMSAGLGVSYMKGLTRHIDFAAFMSGSFVEYPYPDKAPATNADFLLEIDANINAKLLPDNYILVPYISAGVGLSAFKLEDFGAFIPLGTGLQVNLGNRQSFLFLQAQYRVGITDLAANHFIYSIGFAAPLK